MTYGPGMVTVWFNFEGNASSFRESARQIDGNDRSILEIAQAWLDADNRERYMTPSQLGVACGGGFYLVDVVSETREVARPRAGTPFEDLLRALQSGLVSGPA